ncbi:MAG: NAD(P)-binding domain-containing protein [Deltaproteobacteria bacterium]|nr:NAD(P)-binding domain-containing protein [Deltaproteobacteria bacterium]
MKIAVFGTGMVGEAIGTKLVSLGHDVRMGSRSPDNEKATAWAKAAGAKASTGTFADAAAFAEVAFLCVKGDVGSAVLKSVGSALDGKILVDISNPLDFSKGMPPTLFVSNNDSLGETLQREAPKVKVVKTLNTVNAYLMVDAAKLNKGDHTMLMCGDDAGAKARVLADFLTPFGWKDVVDLGGITQARGTEAYLLLWTRLYGALKTPDFNIKLVR